MRRPDGEGRSPPRCGRAHRWKKQLDIGRFQTAQDLAEAEMINPSYIVHVLRLTLLAPEIVVAILDGRQPPGLQLNDLLTPFPVEWARQRVKFVADRSDRACDSTMLGLNLPP